MSGEFYKSLGNIKAESMAMLKTLRAVRGENYARIVHSIILADQIDQAAEVIREVTKEDILSSAVSAMSAKIMDYYLRSSGFSEADIKSAFEDAQRIMTMTYELVDKASTLAKQGHVMGADDAA